MRSDVLRFIIPYPSAFLIGFGLRANGKITTIQRYVHIYVMLCSFYPHHCFIKSYITWKPLMCKSFHRKDKSISTIHMLLTDMTQVFQVLPYVRRETILHSQCHGCWCLGTKGAMQGISNHNIRNVSLYEDMHVYVSKATEECDVMKICVRCGIVHGRLHVTRRDFNV